MKQRVALVLVIGILGVGVFGFLGMDPMMMDHGSSNCVASLVNVVTCPMEAFSSAIYHIQAYASFSQATLSSLFVLALILLILTFLGFGGVLRLQPIAVSYRQKRSADSLSPRHTLLRTLALFEHSPTSR